MKKIIKSKVILASLCIVLTVAYSCSPTSVESKSMSDQTSLILSENDSANTKKITSEETVSENLDSSILSPERAMNAIYDIMANKDEYDREFEIRRAKSITEDSLLRIIDIHFNNIDCEKMNFKTLVDSIRTIIQPIDVSSGNFWIEGLAIAMEKASSTPLSKRMFAIHAAFMLYGIDESMSEAQSTIIYDILKNQPSILQKIGDWIVDLPKEERRKIMNDIAYYLTFELNGEFYPDYTSLYNYIKHSWPDLLPLLQREGIIFEPHTDYMLIGENEYSI